MQGDDAHSFTCALSAKIFMLDKSAAGDDAVSVTGAEDEVVDGSRGEWETDTEGAVLSAMTDVVFSKELMPVASTARQYIVCCASSGHGELNEHDGFDKARAPVHRLPEPDTSPQASFTCSPSGSEATDVTATELPDFTTGGDAETEVSVGVLDAVTEAVISEDE